MASRSKGGLRDDVPARPQGVDASFAVVEGAHDPLGKGDDLHPGFRPLLRLHLLLGQLGEHHRQPPQYSGGGECAHKGHTPNI